MYYGGNYNNDFYQNPRKPKKNKSFTPLIIILSVLIIAAVVFSCFYFYTRAINLYENKMTEYENLLDEYRIDLINYKKDLNDLNSQISNIQKLSNNTNTENANHASAASVPVNININGINIAETAAKVSPSVIGIKVDVPSQNVNSFWSTSPIQASGSGIILTENGYIVTNYHVVSYLVDYNNAVLTVILDDETEHSAEYIGGDEINDLAIIKINANNLPYATLGSSENSKVGDFVIAIGNPLGAYLSGSVTFGIISGVNRKIEAENVAEKLIQTDAAINPGNSGGALLNLNGEVIGINTVKITKSNVEGIGFAIPIDYAKPLIDSIIKYGYVKDRPSLGVSGSDISSFEARIYGVPRGLYIENIDHNSGAAIAGIKINDIITKIDGQNVYALNDISKIIKVHNVGDKVTVTIWRNGEYYDLQVILSEQK